MLALLMLGCEALEPILEPILAPAPEPVAEPPPLPPAQVSYNPPLEQIMDAQGWLTRRGAIHLVGPAGERDVPLIPPIRVIYGRATAWHLFLFAERRPSRREPSSFSLEITDLASGTTCGATLPPPPGEVDLDVVRGEHLLLRTSLSDGRVQARLFDVECRELVDVSAQVVEISPDKAFLATYPGPNATAADEPAVRLFDLGVGIQLGSSYPLDPPARVSQVTWRQRDVEFTLEGDRVLDPIRVMLPP